VGGVRRPDNARRKQALRRWKDRRYRRLDPEATKRERRARQTTILLWLTEQRLWMVESGIIGPHRQWTMIATLRPRGRRTP